MENFEQVFRPKIIDLVNNQNVTLWNSLEGKAIVVDRIYGQLGELVKLRNPKLKLDKSQSENLISELLNGIPVEKYGLWVFYPWSNTLVHTVYENEFIELRTIRNKYKITHEEQAILQNKKIGIVGLSVGHSIAVTMASERICGELRLADFDTLELTNLNRIKTGIVNLGLKKTIIAAREIAEIDPFINVVCYHEGITDDNLLDFLTKDGKIDICIEECDGFYEKFNIRHKCKSLGIPVVMDTSDKGLIDVERYDIEPNRELFHGLTKVSDIEKLRNLTPDQKIPYLYEIINEETMSTRLRASMIELDQTITGWPQLSSAVTFGSGMTTDVTRRILLDQFKSSGRYSVDIESLIKDEDSEVFENNGVENTEIDYKAIIGLEPEKALVVEKTILENIVSDAITAPSGGNSQPWKWVSANNSLILLMDKSRCSHYTDFNDWGAILSLGCATENLLLSASHYGIGVKKQFLNLGDDNFGVKFLFAEKNALDTEKVYREELFNFVKIRQTNRNRSVYKALEESHRQELIDAVVSVPNTQISIIEDKNDIQKLAKIIAEGDLIRFLNKFLFLEMIEEIRWDKKDAIDRPSGIEIDLFDISAKEKIGLKIAASWSVASFVKKIGGNALGDMSYKQIMQSSALVNITMPIKDQEHFFSGGVALERFWLTAAKLGVAVHPFVALNYFFMRLDGNAVDFFSASEIETLKSLKDRWNAILNIPQGSALIFFGKLSYAEPADMSQRISLDKVLEYK